MDVLVNVVGQNLKIATNQKRFVTGTQNFIRFVFKLSADWEGLPLFARFNQDGNLYNRVLDDDNMVYLPSDIMAGEFTLSLQGVGSNIVAKTFEVILYAEKDSWITNEGDDSEIFISPFIEIATLDEVKSYLNI